MQRLHPVRRIFVTFVATIVALLGSAVVASPAQAYCGWTPTRNGEGYLISNRMTHMRTGPYAECQHNLEIGAGKKLWLWCGYHNSYGNYWYYARLDGTNVHGWVFSGNVDTYDYDDNGDGIAWLTGC
ncbi:hypothetical protein [Micromonospora sonneratiae]|uniref:SH3 domain-containing protein n=1 Tax=Micromonospora sonneratiae TaxID=1184706 RepID=A0ABW3Y7V3_9ACTN